MEVNSNGNGYVYNGSTWKRTPYATSEPIIDISCASADFCVGIPYEQAEGYPVDNGGYVLWNGHHWSGKKSAGDVGGITSISCPSKTYCAALTDDGVLVYNGKSWGLPTAVASDDVGPKEISCWRADRCLISATVDINEDTTYLYDGTGVSDIGSPFGDGIIVDDFSCAKSGACAAVSGTDSGVLEIAFSKDPSVGWQRPTRTAAGGPISCGSGDGGRTTCFSTSSGGASGAVHTSGEAWDPAPAPKAPGSTVDASGRPLPTDDGDQWSEASYQFSCASDTWCMSLVTVDETVYEVLAKP